MEAMVDPLIPSPGVLVVEDELLMRMELEAFLHGQGFRVIGPVATTRAALRVLDTEEVDAAILDLNLRGELSTPVAAALAERGIPFMIVSGYRSEDYQYPPLQQAEWLSKPVDERALFRTLRRILNTPE